jgi:hypothetical protein
VRSSSAPEDVRKWLRVPATIDDKGLAGIRPLLTPFVHPGVTHEVASPAWLLQVTPGYSIT